MKRLWNEPLMHFLLLGAALFAAHALLSRNVEADPEGIVVTRGQIEHLATSFARVWQRPPTAPELKGLIDDHVQEEILSREAVKLGLDKNDTVIRRRLRQKMEFIAEDFAVTIEPTQADLEAYYRDHAADFHRESRFTFRHVFLSDDRGDRLGADAVAMLEVLRAGGPRGEPAVLGDPTLLPAEIDGESRSSVAAQFGDGFATDIGMASVGTWSGPFRSSYGTHLVLMTKQTEGFLPPFDEVRDRVKMELLAARRKQMNKDFLDALLDKYDIRVEWPKDASVSEGRTAWVRP
jgi:hypothetical protein